MGRRVAYFLYLDRHRWHVFLASLRLGVPCLGLLHDISKYYPGEFGPYAKHFYRDDGSMMRDAGDKGYYKPTETGDPGFDYAWFLHIKRNKHHWQYWVVPDNRVTGAGFVAVVMPKRYVREMIADWVGASRAQKSASVLEWYGVNKDKIVLAPTSRRLAEALLERMEKRGRGLHNEAQVAG